MAFQVTNQKTGHSFPVENTETVLDAATLRRADKDYVASGGSMKALITSLLTSDSFLYRRVESVTVKNE